MPYTQSLHRLKEELNNQENNLIMFLVTTNNIYSFRSNLTPGQTTDILRPISVFFNDKEFVPYDAYERVVNNVYYVADSMLEYNSIQRFIDLNKQIENGAVDRATIRTAQEEKIKLVIFKKERFMFLYKYNAGKLFTQSWRAIFNNDEAIVERDANSILILSKTVPDIIFDLHENVFFMLNTTQAEYILEIETLFTNTLTSISQNLRNFELMEENGIEMFINEVSGKNTYMRKLHKIKTTGSYQYVHANIDKVPEVIRQYGLNINFDLISKKIIYDEGTDIGDVLHLLADDYVRRYISERDDVVN